MDPSPAHLMDPPVEVRALLEQKVPPDILEGIVPLNLLSTDNKPNKPSNVGSIDMVVLIFRDCVHSGGKL